MALKTPSVKPKETMSTHQREEIRLCNRRCLGKRITHLQVQEEERFCEADNKSKREEDNCASRGEWEGEGKERKQERGMEDFSKFNSSHGKRSLPLPSHITEDSMTKWEDIQHFRACDTAINGVYP